MKCLSLTAWRRNRQEWDFTVASNDQWLVLVKAVEIKSVARSLVVQLLLFCMMS